VRNVFFTSQHRQYVSDPNHALLTKSIGVNKGLVLDEDLLQILDRRIKQLGIMQIPLIKVIKQIISLQNPLEETEDEMQAKYTSIWDKLACFIKADKF